MTLLSRPVKIALSAAVVAMAPSATFSFVRAADDIEDAVDDVAAEDNGLDEFGFAKDLMTKPWKELTKKEKKERKRRRNEASKQKKERKAGGGLGGLGGLGGEGGIPGLEGLNFEEMMKDPSKMQEMLKEAMAKMGINSDDLGKGMEGLGDLGAGLGGDDAAGASSDDAAGASDAAGAEQSEL